MTNANELLKKWMGLSVQCNEDDGVYDDLYFSTKAFLSTNDITLTPSEDDIEQMAKTVAGEIDNFTSFDSGGLDFAGISLTIVKVNPDSKLTWGEAVLAGDWLLEYYDHEELDDEGKPRLIATLNTNAIYKVIPILLNKGKGHHCGQTFSWYGFLMQTSEYDPDWCTSQQVCQTALFGLVVYG